MSRTKWAWLLAAVLAIATICSISIRVNSVNAAVPPSKEHVYEYGDAVPYTSSSGALEDGEAFATLTVLDATVLDGDDMAELAPEHEDGVISAGSAEDVKVLAVSVLIENNSDEEVGSPLALLSAREGAWANGADPVALRSLNPEVESLKLDPGEKLEVVIPFSAYDVQFGFNNEAWRDFGSRGMNLVVRAGLDTVRVDLSDTEKKEAASSNGGERI